jgi:hypothetical protein
VLLIVDVALSSRNASRACESSGCMGMRSVRVGVVVHRDIDISSDSSGLSLVWCRAAPCGRGHVVASAWSRARRVPLPACVVFVERRSAGLAQILPGPEPGGSVYGGKF